VPRPCLAFSARQGGVVDFLSDTEWPTERDFSQVAPPFPRSLREGGFKRDFAPLLHRHIDRRRRASNVLVIRDYRNAMCPRA
jgi:hypothetical protein